MDIWITRDAANVGGAIRAWSEKPKWNGAVWFSEERPTTTAVWLWPSLTFRNHFGFLPEPGACQKMRMQLEPIEEQPNA